MSPATSWTEGSATAPSWFENVPASSRINGFALFGMPIPIVDGIAYTGGSASWTEASVSAASYVEGSATAPTWTEGSL
jgi:hypothetical protein